MGAYAAMLITQGGCGCPIFAESVLNYFAYGKMVNVCIPTEELPSSIKAMVDQV